MAKQHTLSHKTAISEGLKRYHELKKKLGKKHGKNTRDKEWLHGTARASTAIRRAKRKELNSKKHDTPEDKLNRKVAKEKHAAFIAGIQAANKQRKDRNGS